MDRRCIGAILLLGCLTCAGCATGSSDEGEGLGPAKLPGRDAGTGVDTGTSVPVDGGSTVPPAGEDAATPPDGQSGEDTDPNEGGITTERADSEPPSGDVGAPPPTITGAKRIFVSSTGYTGNLGGLAGADAKCASLAAGAGLKGTFKAWLSDATTSAASRLTHSKDPYTLVDGTIVAKDWAQLTSASSTAPLLHAVDMTESGGKPVIWDGAKCNSNPAYRPAWTGTKPDGSSETFYNCDGWTTVTGNLMWGAAFAIATSNAWTQSCYYPKMCSWKAAIYCIEQ